MFVAGIGVFGAGLGQMQVHLTSAMLVLVLLVTVWVQPFGGEDRMLLQVMEALTLVCVWLTLWAGSIFNTYPKCVDPTSGVGGAPITTLPWCDALSLGVGLADMACTGLMVYCFVRVKMGHRVACTACCRRCGGVTGAETTPTHHNSSNSNSNSNNNNNNNNNNINHQ